MKQLFINLKFSKLKNGTAIALFRNIADVVDKADATKLQLKTELTNFNKDIQLFDDAFNGVFSSKFTEHLLALDARRDNDLRGIRLAAKSAKMHRDANMVKAGNTVLLNIDKFGTQIDNKPDKEKTTIVRNIADDAVKPGDFKDAVQTLGLTAWIDAMNLTNNDFEKKYSERNQDVVNNKTQITGSEALKNARKSYEALLKAIDARNTLDTTGKYTALIDAINNLIKNTNTPLKAKESITKTKKAKTVNSDAKQ